MSYTPILARKSSQAVFLSLTLIAVSFAIVFLSILLIEIFFDALPRINSTFLVSPPSRYAVKAGIYPAMTGSLFLMLIVALVSLPLGIAAAIYLEEYAPNNRLTSLIELNIANLAGVPSIIYGLLGLQFFVRVCGFDRSILSGGLTLSLLVLPIVIVTAREALKSVPQSIRQGALALGSTQWQSIFYQVLPIALPGIITGCILAFSRAIGETAPLITMGALTYVAYAPTSIFSAFTALPIQAYNWLSRPQEAFHANAAGAIVVLLIMLLILNAMAIFLRIKYQKRCRF